MDIYMKSFSKRENSTLQPVFASSDKYECVLKDSTSILNPTIQIYLESGDPSTLNYAYIQAFERYYWINDWSWEGGVWNASLSVDPLASWKTSIGSQTVYIARSDVPLAIANTDAFSDNYYTSTFNGYTRNYIPITVLFEQRWDDGSYVIGVQSGGSAGIGAIKYFALSPTMFSVLVTKLMSKTVWYDDSGITSLTDALMYQMNPIQYISSVMWYPFDVSDLPISSQSLTNTFNVGWWTLTLGSTFTYYELNENGYIQSYSNINISQYVKHPQASTRGNFLKYAPYTSYELFFPPYGTVSLPSEVMGSTDYFAYEFFVECINGQSKLLLGTGLDSNNHVSGQFMNLECQVGVPIQMSQITQNLLGSAVKTTAAAASALTGNVMSTASNCLEALESLLPTYETIGKNGSLIDYLNTPYLEFKAMQIADDASDHVGRPLNHSYTINALAKDIFNTSTYSYYENSGYIKVMDADITIACTATELSQIKSFLEGGFFYE